MAVADLVRSPTFLIKIVELVLSILIAGLTSNQVVAVNPDALLRYGVVYGTTVGFIIVGALIVIGYILACPLDNKLILISSGAAFLLYFVSGGLIIDAYTRGVKVAQVLIGGILGLLNGLVYAGDAFLTWKFS